MSCVDDHGCEGAILISSYLRENDSELDFGRSDLSVSAGGTRVIAVPVPSGTVDELNKLGARVLSTSIAVLNSDPTCREDTRNDPFCVPSFVDTVIVNGPAIPKYSITPMDLHFPDTQPGGTATLEATVTNVSGVTQSPNLTYGHVGHYPNFFGGGEGCNGQTLPPDGSCLITFEFHPTGGGFIGDSRVVILDGEGYLIELDGNGS
jgi:hypothetical protein